MSNVKQYRKKPVVIEAWWFTIDGGGTPEEVAEWCGGKLIGEDDFDTIAILIPTLEGEMRAEYGDYIIKGVKGEFYPVKPDIFHETYEEA